MEKKSSWLLRASASTGLVLLFGSGCMKDLDSLSALYGTAGTGGKGHAGASGHGASGTSGSSHAGEAGASGEAGAAGETSSGGTGATGGTGGGSCTLCGDSEDCIDITMGTPDGSTGVTNCGECDFTCSLDNANSASCKAGACQPKCSAGFGDCATSANDGCETDLTTITNCGSCGTVCNQAGVATPMCTSGHCTPMCTPIYGDCNAGATPVPNDGCEVFLDALDHCTTGCSVAGVACDPTTQVCNGGACVAPQGLVVMSTPLVNQSDAQRYSDVFQIVPVNLEGTTITIRLYAPGATGGSLAVFFSDNNSGFGPPTQFDLATLSQKWTDVTIPATTSGGYDAKITKQVNLLVSGGGTTMTNPTVIYVDSVRTSNSVINDTFDANLGLFVKSTFVTLAGSTLTWTSAMP